MTDWDFGDFPFGLELLTMPPVGPSRATAVTPYVAGPCDPGLTVMQLRLLADSPLLGDVPEDARKVSHEQIFWFRWITGHQITFVIWHLMGKLLERTAERGEPDQCTAARLGTYTSGYNAMLLYTGSCPLDTYQSLIRPRMYLQHRSFSGTWASDFTPVRSLFRGRGPVRGATREAARLARAVEINKAIHDGIAAQLVPAGKSLLQEAMAGPVVRPSERTALLYDNFFMTLRGPVDDDAIITQLLRRLRAVALDLAVNGLHPLGHEGEERPEELRRAEVADCENRIGHVLYEVGEAAVTPAGSFSYQ
ncbi:hypothetical protein ACFV2X_21810 [Streptomyces sp. NPDC059679]|uniref:hypothetical protein n=1 Tax=Streptomyces sp. NPDC059679 TaxID=3346903 RepID=UPI0036B5C6B6